MDKELFSSLDNADQGTVSYTFDDSGKVLALVKTDPEGTLSLRDSGKWAEVGKDDDAPEIFDRDIVDVKPENNTNAINKFDASQHDNEQLTRGDVDSLL